jgi:hypothetical protein
MPLLTLTPLGLHCERGDFATWGSRAYLTSKPGVAVLRARLEPGASIRGAEYGRSSPSTGLPCRLIAPRGQKPAV